MIDEWSLINDHWRVPLIAWWLGPIPVSCPASIAHTYPRPRRAVWPSRNSRKRSKWDVIESISRKISPFLRSWFWSLRWTRRPISAEWWPPTSAGLLPARPGPTLAAATRSAGRIRSWGTRASARAPASRGSCRRCWRMRNSEKLLNIKTKMSSKLTKSAKLKDIYRTVIIYF